MINSEHNLTVDDLIVEYMIFKVKNGYEPQFLASEFIEFLHFFESKMSVQDILYESEQLFQRFFERKAEYDWHRWNPKEMFLPHMEMMYSKDDDDYIIKANYRLSDYDLGCLNTYYMSDGKLEKGKTAEIRKLIGEFLSGQPKRKIDETIEVDENALIVGKHIAAKIVNVIWNKYVSDLINFNQWPMQCKDIEKYLFNIDLAEIIGLKSIKNELLDFYRVISKRIAVLYQQDKNLEISSRSNGYSLYIDLKTSTFKESYEAPGIYYMWDSHEFIITTTRIGNDDVQQLVRTLDGNISKN